MAGLSLVRVVSDLVDVLPVDAARVGGSARACASGTSRARLPGRPPHLGRARRCAQGMPRWHAAARSTTQLLSAAFSRAIGHDLARMKPAASW